MMPGNRNAMKTKTSKPAGTESATSRRELLKGLSLAGLAAGSTTFAAIPAQAEPAPTIPADLSYSETDHIRKFYDLARR
jgi:hypothetical protein